MSNPFELLPDETLIGILLNVPPSRLPTSCRLNHRFANICRDTQFRCQYDQRWSLHYRRKYAGKTDWGLQVAIDSGQSDLINYFYLRMQEELTSIGEVIPNKGPFAKLIGPLNFKVEHTYHGYASLILVIAKNYSYLVKAGYQVLVETIVENYIETTPFSSLWLRSLGIAIGRYGQVEFSNKYASILNLGGSFYVEGLLLGFISGLYLDHLRHLLENRSVYHLDSIDLNTLYQNLAVAYFKIYQLNQDMQSEISLPERTIQYMDKYIKIIGTLMKRERPEFDILLDEKRKPKEFILQLTKAAILTDDFEFFNQTLLYLLPTPETPVIDLFITIDILEYMKDLIHPAASVGNTDIIDQLIGYTPQLYITSVTARRELINKLISYNHLDLLDYYFTEEYSYHTWLSETLLRSWETSVEYLEKAIFSLSKGILLNLMQPAMEECFGNLDVLKFLVNTIVSNATKHLNILFSALIRITFESKLVECAEFLVDSAIQHQIEIDWSPIFNYFSRTRYWILTYQRLATQYYQVLSVKGNQLLQEAARLSKQFDLTDTRPEPPGIERQYQNLRQLVESARNYGATDWFSYMIAANQEQDFKLVYLFARIFLDKEYKHHYDS